MTECKAWAAARVLDFADEENGLFVVGNATLDITAWNSVRMAI
jgi:hypothetical protein